MSFQKYCQITKNKIKIMEATKSQPAKAGTKPEPFETVCRICHKKVKTEVTPGYIQVFCLCCTVSCICSCIPRCCCHELPFMHTCPNCKSVSSGLINAKTLHKYYRKTSFQKHGINYLKNNISSKELFIRRRSL